MRTLTLASSKGTNIIHEGSIFIIMLPSEKSPPNTIPVKIRFQCRNLEGTDTLSLYKEDKVMLGPAVLRCCWIGI